MWLTRVKRSGFWWVFSFFKLLQMLQQQHVSQRHVDSFLVDIAAVRWGRCPASRRSSRGSSSRLLQKSTSKSLGGWWGVGGGGVGGRTELHLDRCKNNGVSASRIKPRQMPPRFGRAGSTREPPDPRLRRSQLGSSARRRRRIFMSGRRVMPCQVVLWATRRRKSSQRWRITPPPLRQSNTGLPLSKRGRRLHVYIPVLTCASSWILSSSAHAGTFFCRCNIWQLFKILHQPAKTVYHTKKVFFITHKAKAQHVLQEL